MGVRLLDRDPVPVTELAYRQARRGGGSESVRLTVHNLRVDALPDGVEALVLAGDLQGVAPSPWGGESVLLGVALADYLTVWAGQGLLPPPERVGVVLAGDLYSAATADVRGASGSVDEVWLALAVAGCRFVVGVLGNHDEVSTVELAGPLTLLEASSVERGGARFGGVGGIIGDPERPGRREERAHLADLRRVLADNPAMLVLHEGPPGELPEQRGSETIGAVVAQAPPPLTVCGHVHWEHPVSALGDGHVLNVDGRVLVLVR